MEDAGDDCCNLRRCPGDDDADDDDDIDEKRNNDSINEVGMMLMFYIKQTVVNSKDEQNLASTLMTC